MYLESNFMYVTKHASIYKLFKTQFIEIIVLSKKKERNKKLWSWFNKREKLLKTSWTNANVFLFLF